MQLDASPWQTLLVSQAPRFLIVGGGIAGLAAAWAIGRRFRNASLTLVEREPRTFSQSSGSNAAILRPLESSHHVSALAMRSYELLQALQGGAPLLDRRGLVLAGNGPASLGGLLEVATSLNLPHDVLDAPQLWARSPALQRGTCTLGVYLPTAGVFELSELARCLQQRIEAAGGVIQVAAKVRHISSDGQRVRGVVLEDGQVLVADEVVIAAGAGSAALGASCDCPLPLQSYRRHLVELQSCAAVAAAHPPTWCLDEGVYFRPTSAGILACPGDESPHPPTAPEVDPEVLPLLSRLLHQVAPALSAQPILRSWACLRIFAPDREAVVGSDPRLPGLHWLCGLGGFGMSAGLACAELLSQHLAHDNAELLRPLSPARLVQP